MKKIALPLLLLILPSAFAACTGGNDQLIFRISNLTNAHAELYNGAGNYGVEVCYDQLFGLAYSGLNPHDCTGTNSVLNASNTTNAHAEQKDQANYSTNICFGDFECGYTATGGGGSPACSSWRAGAKCIATISAATNAHVSSICDGAESYPIAICCAVSGPTNLKIISFTLEPNSVVTDAAGKTITALVKLNNPVAAGTVITINVKDLGGNTKFGPTNMAQNSPKEFIATFSVDNSWKLGNYVATATLQDRGNKMTAYLFVSSFSSAIPETSIAIVPLVALLAIAIIYFSAKRK